ncbi:MAG: hypothetical protein WCQ53_04095 [bacterium]
MPVLSLIYAFINLIILGLVLFFALRKSVGATLVNRKEDFIKKSKEAHDYYQESVKNFDQIQHRMSNIEQEAYTYLEETKNNANRLGIATIEDAKRAANVLIEDAKHLVGAEARQMRNKIREKFVSSIIEQTKVKLSTNVNDIKRNEYIDEYSREKR